MTRISALTLLLAMFSLAACNTVRGIGEDVSAGGKAITEASDEVEQDIKSY